MKTRLTIIQGGAAKSRLELKAVKEAVRICVDRDSTGNLDAMMRKLKEMNAASKPHLELVAGASVSTQQTDR